MGSAVLTASLMEADRIDAYLLMIHPLVLGGGRRMFPEHVNARLRVIDSVSTPTIAAYEPERDERLVHARPVSGVRGGWSLARWSQFCTASPSCRWLGFCRAHQGFL